MPTPRGREDCNIVRTLRRGKSYDNHNNRTEKDQPAVTIYAENTKTTADSVKKQNLFGTKTVLKQVYEGPIPYPERLKPKAKDKQLKDFMQTLSKVQINLALRDAMKNIPSYAKFLKAVCTHKKKLVDFEKRLGQGDLKHTSVILQLVDRSISYPREIIEDLIIKVDNLYLPADFVVLDKDEDLQTPIILGRSFMATARTLIDVEGGALTMRVQDQSLVFRIFEAAKCPEDQQECMWADVLKGVINAEIMTKLTSDSLLSVLHGPYIAQAEDAEISEYVTALDSVPA
ncbi:hypothetical protein L3X38_036878 [Prunus dulcis]|uniref:Uncharacterized protein n=1 Tax=Prunus dulcis TaxID=3755 RepID=A0AAD4V3J1_PRUDU|nr:hypothetical protein L3X38_036878 [Prunus dulcis]